MKIIISLIFLLVTSQTFAQNETEKIQVSPLPSNIKKDIEEKNFALAVDKLKKYVSINPNNYRGVYSLGKVLALEGKYDESLKYLEQARTMKEQADIQDASIYNAVGWTKFLIGDTVGAKRDIQMILESQESVDRTVKETALNNLGIIYMYTKQNDEAKIYFEQAAQQYNSRYAKENIDILKTLEMNKQAVQAKPKQ